MDFRLSDILDLQVLEEMLESLWHASGIPMGIVGAGGDVLVATGWQKICAEFHRKHPDLGERCLLNKCRQWSEHELTKHGPEPFEFVCDSGLVDIALPFYFEEQYLGFLFLGQFLYEPPDPARYSEQAVRFGFEPDAYLEMLDEVPIIPEEKVKEFLDFHLSLVRLLSDSGLRKLKEVEARRDLEESEATFRSLFDHANDGIGIVALDGKILQVNPALCRLLGYSRDELLRLSLQEISDPSIHHRIIEWFAKIRREEKELFEMLLKTRAGTVIPVEISCRLFQYRGQSAVLGNVRDLSERVASERALMESENRFRTIFESAAVGMATTSSNGLFSKVNPKFCDFLGYSEEELLNMSIVDVTAPEDRRVTRELIQEATRDGRLTIDVEKRYLRKDGTQVWGRVTAAHLPEDEDSSIASIAMIQDISEHKEFERALQESEQKFRSVVDSSPLGLVMYSLKDDGRLILEMINPAAETILGIDSQQLIGKEMITAFPNLVATGLKEIYQEICATGRPWYSSHFEYQDQSIKGVFEVHAFKAGPRKVACNFMEITERIRREEALRNSEATLKSILTTAPMAVGMVKSRIFSWVNRWMTDVTGYDLKELIGQNARMLYESDEEYAKVAAVKYPDVTEGRIGEIQTRWVCKDGRKIDVLLRSRAIDPNDLDAGVIFSGLDITEMKRANEELIAKEEQVRLLLDSSGEAVYGLDVDGRCTFVNPECLELLGYQDEDELLGQNAHQMFHHSHLDGTPYPVEECLIYQAHRKGESVHVAGEVLWRKDGSSFPAEYWSSPIFKDGMIVGAVVNFVDISERQWAEDALKKALEEAQDARLQVDGILRSIADGLIVVTTDQRIVLANDAAQQMLGKKRADLYGGRLEEFLSDEALKTGIARALAGENITKPIDLMPRHHEDDREIFLQARIASMRFRQEKISGVIISLRDVTRARELDRLKDEFITTAAHELRTPMTSILGYTELTLEKLPDLEPELLKKFLNIIRDRSNTLVTIIGDMLDLSRVQSGHLISLDVDVGNLNELLRQAVVPYRMEKPQHIFAVQVADDVSSVIFDSKKIAQVLDNLISNAVKFSPEGGTIHLKAEYGEDVVVTVADNGIGMTPEQVERVFDKFFRVDASNTAVSGLGLGMSLVKGIIEAHGGEIWVKSQPDVGTEVSFSLPLKPATECET